MSKMNICRIILDENMVTLHFGDTNTTTDWILNDSYSFFIFIIDSSTSIYHFDCKKSKVEILNICIKGPPLSENRIFLPKLDFSFLT